MFDLDLCINDALSVTDRIEHGMTQEYLPLLVRLNSPSSISTPISQGRTHEIYARPWICYRIYNGRVGNLAVARCCFLIPLWQLNRRITYPHVRMHVHKCMRRMGMGMHACRSARM